MSLKLIGPWFRLRFFLVFWDLKIFVLVGVGRSRAKGFSESRAVLEDESGASNGPEYGQRVGSDVNVGLEHRHPANIKLNFGIFSKYLAIIVAIAYRFSKDFYLILT